MMKNTLVLVGLIFLIFSGCSAPASTPVLIRETPTFVIPSAVSTATNTTIPRPPTATIAPTRTATVTPTVTMTPAYPPAGLEPDRFPEGINPLTGLPAAKAGLLNRRPVVVKVENLPRDHRPQWGLSLADLVYEYYTEEGTTRFAAVYYGQDAQRVGPIRSARLFDQHVVSMYGGIFVFGYADPIVWRTLLLSEFGKRLIVERPDSCPPLCRYDAKRSNILVVDTGEVPALLKLLSIDNTRPALNGMYFKLEPPSGGSKLDQLFVRYSAAIYNRWDYQPSTGRYQRYSDSDNDLTGKNEKYALLTDKLTGNPIAVENVVTIFVPNRYFSRTPEIVDIQLNGTGRAYIARDGQIFRVTWSRTAAGSPLTLLGDDGKLFPFKPGQTWFEIVGEGSGVQRGDLSYRIIFSIP